MAFEKETCPYCGFAHCEAEWTDVGIGYVQHAPYFCDACGAFEIGGFDKVEATADEKATGWYAPSRTVLPTTVSSINGKRVSTETALALYKKGLVSQVPFQISLSASDTIDSSLKKFLMEPELSV